VHIGGPCAGGRGGDGPFARRPPSRPRHVPALAHQAPSTRPSLAAPLRPPGAPSRSRGGLRSLGRCTGELGRHRGRRGEAATAPHCPLWLAGAVMQVAAPPRIALPDHHVPSGLCSGWDPSDQTGGTVVSPRTGGPGSATARTAMSRRRHGTMTSGDQCWTLPRVDATGSTEGTTLPQLWDAVSRSTDSGWRR
jgi:hypothetical protein